MDGATFAIALAVFIPVMFVTGFLINMIAKRSAFLEEQRLTEQLEEAERQLKEEKESRHDMEVIYRHVKNYNPYLIYVVSHYKELTTCTTSAARLLGFSDGELPGKQGISIFLEAGVEKKLFDEVIETIQSGREYYNVVPLNLKGGSGTFQVHAQQICMEEDEGAIIFLTDVTNQLVQNEKVIEALRTRDRLILAMSHEVRTPLNAIIGSADLMSLTDNLSEKERVHMRNIHEASHALLNIVNETLDYAKIESNEMRVENKRFDFLEMLLQIRTALYIKTISKGIDFFLDVEPDIPKHIIGDEARLRQVLTHILSNAIKYTDEGYIRLRITKKEVASKTYLRYEIKDTGIGIREENQKDIFKAFSVLSEKEHEYRNGIGLGLMVCQKLISLMGGEILFESEWEKGTTFYFELELVGSENDPIACVKQTEQKSILICSDDELLAKHLIEMIGKMGVRASWNREMNMVEEFYTHIMIDNKMVNAREWLERDMPYSCEKILVIEDSRSASSAMKKADRIMYYPIVCNMIADVLNKSELSNFKKDKKGKRELIFKVRSLTALIVDDNSVNTLVAANILKQFGFVTEEVSSAALAIKKVYAKKYDVIFMDYQMPEMDGIQATREVRKLEYGKDVLLFALTANITEDITAQFKDAGANDIIAKPLELKDLSELLLKWLPKEALSDDKKEENSVTVVQMGSTKKETVPDGDGKQQSFMQAMQLIPEIDVELGLSHVLGDVDGYIKILEISNNNISQAFEAIRELVKAEKYDEMRIHFHSLKGILANIGGQELSEQSKKMEFAARDHEHVYIKTYLENYLTCVDNFMESLDKALSAYRQDNKAQEVVMVIPEEEKKEMLKQLSYLISRFEINDVGRLFEQLIASSEGEEKETLIKANNEIENFQYDKALEILEELSGAGRGEN